VLAQTIGFMLKNEDEAGRLAANGYRRVCKDYSAKRMAEQYLSMYDKMVVGDQSSGERLSL
jgi:glycosyltransferase involved in cell wall biosynthesis